MVEVVWLTLFSVSICVLCFHRYPWLEKCGEMGGEGPACREFIRVHIFKWEICADLVWEVGDGGGGAFCWGWVLTLLFLVWGRLKHVCVCVCVTCVAVCDVCDVCDVCVNRSKV